MKKFLALLLIFGGALSHIIEVSKTATGTRLIDYDWPNPQKTAATPSSNPGDITLSFTLNPGNPVLTTTCRVTGRITAFFPADLFTGQAGTWRVFDLVNGVPAASQTVSIRCNGTNSNSGSFTGQITVVCDYEVTYPGTNNECASTTNSAWATLERPNQPITRGDSAAVPVTFPTTIRTNECVEISDRFDGRDRVVVGTVCFDNVRSLPYSVVVHVECGQYQCFWNKMFTRESTSGQEREASVQVCVNTNPCPTTQAVTTQAITTKAVTTQLVTTAAPPCPCVGECCVNGCTFPTPGVDPSLITFCQTAAADKKVRLCHGTSSVTNPYVGIEISINALDQHLENHHKNGPQDFDDIVCVALTR